MANSGMRKARRLDFIFLRDSTPRKGHGVLPYLEVAIRVDFLIAQAGLRRLPFIMLPIRYSLFAPSKNVTLIAISGRIRGSSCSKPMRTRTVARLRSAAGMGAITFAGKVTEG